MMTKAALWSQYRYLAFPILGGIFGWYLDRLETERMIRFRDKSALYGRTLAPGEPPSWP